MDNKINQLLEMFPRLTRTQVLKVKPNFHSKLQIKSLSEFLCINDLIMVIFSFSVTHYDLHTLSGY